MNFDELRRRMIAQHLRARGIQDERVLAAFANVPRDLFVPEALQAQAYADHPLPIGSGQMISQPYIVALMTELLELQGHERVLEIGTGSGYQTAMLAQLALEVYSVERLPELAALAAERLQALGYRNAHVRYADGSFGWPEQAPFDGIIVTAAVPKVPEPLIAQLAEGGRLVLPIGTQAAQTLVQARKRHGALQPREVAACVFVPLLGEHGWSETTE